MALNKQEKEQFIKDLIDNVQKSMLEQLDRVPEKWDGFELKHWTVDAFSRTLVNCPESRRQRLRDYRNDRVIKNLV